jgi:membrane dipeptidase
VEERSSIVLFDGHNDAVQFIAEYRAGGRNFLERSDEGHLDLVRAREGGLIGGMFAMFAKPERAPADDLTATKNGYEVRLADPVFSRNEKLPPRLGASCIEADASRSKTS